MLMTTCWRRHLPWIAISISIAVVACHSEPYDTPPEAALGPRTTGDEIQLTYSDEQDYWPAWTEDGQGILYAFVDPSHPRHRCIGMLPAAGGTRRWQLCDNRGIRNDTLSSYGAFALDTAGRLLVAEATSPTGRYDPVPRVTLWVADTADPYHRQQLLVLPVTVGTMPVTWLAELQWTGPTTFLALGQQVATETEEGIPTDTSFSSGGIVVEGTIADGHATLRPIAGTDSATGYSLAEGGSVIAFSRRHDLRVATVPRSGGVATPAPIIRSGPDSAALVLQEIDGLSCVATSCIVAIDRFIAFGTYVSSNAPGCSLSAPLCTDFGARWPGVHSLHRISLTTGGDDVLTTDGRTISTPLLSPVNGDLVVQLDGLWGHLQSRQSVSADGNIWLMKGVGQ
ncbi:MAG TPA: hypothetical protein VGM77_10175 [Gemmatimonadales bacterium]|jgi:hypothetical protein